VLKSSPVLALSGIAAIKMQTNTFTTNGTTFTPVGTVGPVGTSGTGFAMQNAGGTGFSMQTTSAKQQSIVKYQYPSVCSCSCMPIWIWCLTVTLLSLVLILIMQHLNFGRVVYNREGDEYTVHIGSSLDTNSDTKCVEVPAGVHCPSDVERRGREEWPDKFHIYHDGIGRVCAHRVDHQSAWGLDLNLMCSLSPTTSGESARVVIGNTLATPGKSTKCVRAPEGVVCDNSAAQLGRTGQYKDTFDVYHKNGEVCAHRTDRPTSWGLNLVLQCRRGQNAKQVSFTDITIGNTLSTKSDTKCVDDPGTVICDNAAEQVGRDGRWKDKFNVYMKDGKICAHRTDSKGAWGLNLVLRCKNKLQSS